MKLLLSRSLASLLVLSLTHVAAITPHAEAMLAPANTVSEAPAVDRETDLKTIQSALESKMLREKLHKLGLTDAEIDSRLSRLSNAQVHQLASQIKAVNPAGEVIVTVLIIVLLVVVILYFLNRV